MNINKYDYVSSTVSAATVILPTGNLCIGAVVFLAVNQSATGEILAYDINDA